MQAGMKNVMFRVRPVRQGVYVEVKSIPPVLPIIVHSGSTSTMNGPTSAITPIAKVITEKAIFWLLVNFFGLKLGIGMLENIALPNPNPAVKIYGSQYVAQDTDVMVMVESRSIIVNNTPRRIHKEPPKTMRFPMDIFDSLLISSIDVPFHFLCAIYFPLQLALRNIARIP